MKYHELGLDRGFSAPKHILLLPLDEIQQEIKAAETKCIHIGTCLHSPRRALIDGLSAWMCQTGKTNYRSPKQYLYWLSWLEFAFVRKINFPLSITNKQTCCIFLIFFSLKGKTFKPWNIFTIKEGPMLVLTLIKCLSPLSRWISFICIFGSHFLSL